MRGYSEPPWPAGSGWRRGSQTVPPSELRVSDDERQEIAGALSQHYADGRLDQAEFEERMGQTMSAKTRGDLDGLLRDLPPLHDPKAGHPATSSGRRTRGLLAIIFTTLFLVTTTSWGWHALTWHSPGWRPHISGLAILLGVALFVSLRARGRRVFRRGI